MNEVHIIECPRDAMQGIKAFIPTEQKIQYIQSLLRVGFHTIDVGSFVSPKAIPQMVDTIDVIKGLNLSNYNSKLLTIVANVRGAEEACGVDEVSYLGFPFSISEIFQMRNTHKTIQESLKTLEKIKAIADTTNKEVVTYLSMGFGNPYGDPWNVDIVSEWTERLYQMGIQILSLSDTIGVATPETITYLFSNLIAKYPDIEFGAHLHTTRTAWFEKVDAAYKAGCSRFDGAIQGYGGCPMAKDELIGNMPTEKLVSYFTSKHADTNISAMSFESAYNEASKIFKFYH
ncbi:hydroxymethylglutaryl-CoA lyase [Neptunitalea chrysea]|uniref:Hydroxymethylglutaryl-CoA lyase n=1 Tax=Neptunitalea chrysea TaxID=1647581 RepID=A0A9W6B5T7_9FLAO|nr:hydroxymethylglutaryl-CoA lyase [Neptunitalea chrysea]GLB52155.1 hydroxymethylglutaryl-CoA lyase [Neptunitalea chrysea]